MVAGHMAVPQFRGPITYCVLQWCHPMLTGTQRRTSCSTRMITLFGDHVIKLDSGSVGRGDSPGVGDSFANIFAKTYEFRNILSVGNGLLGFDCLGILTFLPPANEVWGKVIFSEACVKNSVHGGGGVCLSACWDTTPRDQTSPPGSRACWEIRSMCRRYASYWNAFFLGRRGHAPPPPGGPNSFNFMQSLGKFDKFVCWRPPPPGELAPPPRGNPGSATVSHCIARATCYCRSFFCFYSSIHGEDKRDNFTKG